MNIPSEHNLQEHEISLDSTEGLSLFVTHFEEQFRELTEAAALIEEDPSVLPEIKRGKEAYYKLLGCTTQAKNLLEEATVDEDLLEAMQAAYDEFLSVYLVVTSKAEAERKRQATEKKTLEGAFSARNLRKDSILTEKLLQDIEVREAIERNFGSPAGFESRLWRLVRQIEEPSKLDRVLRVQHGSIFTEILRGSTVAEVDQFLDLTGEQVRAALLEMQYEDGVQYDYRTYIIWIDLYREMKAVIDPELSTLFEELFAVYQIVLAEASYEE